MIESGGTLIDANQPMDLDKMNAEGEKITAELVRMRERVGASLANYKAEGAVIDITGADLQKLAAANPGEPIIINGKFHFAYIKDHYFAYKYDHDAEARRHPVGCYKRGNKVHFYHCRTLQQMTDAGRDARYRCASRIRNEKRIDLRDAEVETRLALCKNCISLLPGPGFSFRRWISKDKIAEYGDARRLMDFVEADHKCDREAKDKVSIFYRNLEER